MEHEHTIETPFLLAVINWTIIEYKIKEKIVMRSKHLEILECSAGFFHNWTLSLEASNKRKSKSKYWKQTPRSLYTTSEYYSTIPTFRKKYFYILF